jgi:hypothetical protein
MVAMVFGFSLPAAVSLLLLVPAISASQPPKVLIEWTADTYPGSTEARCGNYSSSICDPDRILGNRGRHIKVTHLKTRNVNLN